MNTPTNSVAAAFALQSFTTLPPRTGGSEGLYPFKHMSPGRAFFVPLKSDTDKDTPKKLSTAASQAGSKLGQKFSVRTHADEIGLFGPKGVIGVGVYCVKDGEDEEGTPEADAPEGEAPAPAVTDAAAAPATPESVAA